ncbi:MAG: hypothetical protein M3Z22_06240, partial [Verrucomicrobiota bacterium]|nr:hypothetical protein [Verrucomicrobiota bacterium]
AGDYGYCWQPSIAVSDRHWRPYSDGYWAYTDVGWTWVSYEDFGWATYHYGRWARLRDHGWVWVPGREWGPAWVSWRTGGDYVGWAPLPPRYRGGEREVVYEGRSINNNVDIDFDIGPLYYNFVDVRYIGEPVLRERIFDPEQNVNYINSTVNVTNITYNNSRFYDYGPDYARLSAYSTRPIRRMTLERETNVDYGAAAQTGFTRVQGDRLLVSAPQMLQAPAPQQQLAPKSVQARIAQPHVETGWSGITDPTAKAELQQKIRKEDPKSVPPPKIQPTNPAALTAGSPANTAPVSGTATPLMGARPNDKGKKEKGKGQLTESPAITPEGAATPSVAGAPATALDRKGKNRKDKGAPQAVPPPATVPAAEDAAAATAAPVRTKPEQKGKGGNGRTAIALPPAPAVRDKSEAAGSAPVAPPERGKGQEKREKSEKSARPTSVQPPEGPVAAADEVKPAPNQNKHEQREHQNAEPRIDRRNVVPPPSQPRAVEAAPPVEKPRPEVRQIPPRPPQEVAPRNAPAERAPQQGKPEKPKKEKKGEESPVNPEQ